METDYLGPQYPGHGLLVVILKAGLHFSRKTVVFSHLPGGGRQCLVSERAQICSYRTLLQNFYGCPLLTGQSMNTLAWHCKVSKILSLTYFSPLFPTTLFNWGSIYLFGAQYRFQEILKPQELCNSVCRNICAFFCQEICPHFLLFLPFRNSLNDNLYMKSHLINRKIIPTLTPPYLPKNLFSIFNYYLKTLFAFYLVSPFYEFMSYRLINL